MALVCLCDLIVFPSRQRTFEISLAAFACKSSFFGNPAGVCFGSKGRCPLFQITAVLFQDLPPRNSIPVIRQKSGRQRVLEERGLAERLLLLFSIERISKVPFE